MNKYYIFSEFDINCSNRGNAALAYGAVSFLKEFHPLKSNRIVLLKFYKKFWKYRNKQIEKADILIENEIFLSETYYIFYFEYLMAVLFRLRFPFMRLGSIMKKAEYVVAINGGDGFSDIYGTKSFKDRLFATRLALVYGIPIIQMPQTLGPFKIKRNYLLAKKILLGSSKVYVRDLAFKEELARLGVEYELKKDLSYYMKPQCEGAIKVLPNSVGLNISGLAYSNKFRALSNRFDAYPLLIRRLIESFQKLNISVYLVSHSYNYERPEEFNDDLIACKQVFESLPSQEFVYLIDDNLNSPQTKQLISQFDFFIGTRMHACFAAIYTKTPVFGLAYSYKFKGAFDENGLQGNYVDIVNISVEDVKSHVEKIINVYIEQNKRGAI